MKNQMKLFLTLAVMLIGTMTAWADGLVEITKQKAGVETSEGEVTAVIADGQCTLTVTCPEGYGLRASDITAVRVLDTEFMQSRRADAPMLTSTPPVDNDEITVTGANGIFVFDMPESPYDVNVTVNFQPLVAITFDSDGGSEVASIIALPGDAISAPEAPTKNGYTFTGWYDGTQAYVFTTMPEGGKALKAKWHYVPQNDVLYTVEHYLANIDGAYPDTPTEAYQLSGTEGSDTQAEAKSYEGFTAQAFSQAAINANGSTVVKIYYARNQYTITFDSDGGSEVADIVAYYGAAVTAPENPTKDGYVFNGWDAEIPATMPIGGVGLTGSWLRLGDVDGVNGINAQDASLILQYVVGKIKSNTIGFRLKAADVDGANGVNAQDASLVLQYVVGKVNW